MQPIELLDDAPSCADASRQSDITVFMSAFGAARMTGAGAEDCLTATALDHYCDADGAACTDHQLDFAPGPNCLYACYSGRLSAFQVDSRPAAAGGYEVYLSAQYDGDYGGANEHIVVTVRDGGLIISEVGTSA